MVNFTRLNVENGRKSERDLKYLTEVQGFSLPTDKLSHRDENNDCITIAPDASQIGYGSNWANPHFVSSVNKYEQFAVYHICMRYNVLPTDYAYQLLPRNNPKLLKFIPYNNTSFFSVLNYANLNTNNSRDYNTLLTTSMLNDSVKVKYPKFNRKLDKLYLDPLDFKYKDITTNQVVANDSPETDLLYMQYKYNFRDMNTDQLLATLRDKRISIEKFPFYGTHYVDIQYTENKEKERQFINNIVNKEVEKIDVFNTNYNDELVLWDTISQLATNVDYDNKSFTLDNINYIVDNGFINQTTNEKTKSILFNGKYLLFNKDSIKELYFEFHKNEILDIIKEYKYTNNSTSTEDYTYTPDNVINLNNAYIQNVDNTYDIYYTKTNQKLNEVVVQEEDEEGEIIQKPMSYYRLANEVFLTKKINANRNNDIYNILTLVFNKYELNNNEYTLNADLVLSSINTLVKLMLDIVSEDQIENTIFKDVISKTLIPFSKDFTFQIHNNFQEYLYPLVIKYRDNNDIKIKLLDMQLDEYYKNVKDYEKTFDRVLPFLLYYNCYTGTRPIWVWGTTFEIFLPVPYKLFGLYSFKYPFGCYNQYDKYVRLSLINRGDNIREFSKVETPKYVDKEYKINNSKKASKMFRDPDFKFYVPRQYGQNIDAPDTRYKDCNYQPNVWASTSQRNLTSIYLTYGFSLLFYLHPDFRNTIQLRDMLVKYMRYLNKKYSITENYKDLSFYIPDRQPNPYKRKTLRIKKEQINIENRTEVSITDNNILEIYDYKKGFKYYIDLYIYYPKISNLKSKMVNERPVLRASDYIGIHLFFTRAKGDNALKAIPIKVNNVIGNHFVYVYGNKAYAKLLNTFDNTKYTYITLNNGELHTFNGKYNGTVNTIEEGIDILIEQYKKIYLDIDDKYSKENLLSNLDSIITISRNELEEYLNNKNEKYYILTNKNNPLEYLDEFHLNDNSILYNGKMCNYEYHYEPRNTPNNQIDVSYNINAKWTNFSKLMNSYIDDNELINIPIWLYEIETNPLVYGISINKTSRENIAIINTNMQNTPLDVYTKVGLLKVLNKYEELNDIAKSLLFQYSNYYKTNSINEIIKLNSLADKDVEIIDYTKALEIFKEDVFNYLNIVVEQNVCTINNYTDTTIDNIKSNLIYASLNRNVDLDSLADFLKENVYLLPTGSRILRVTYSNVEALKYLLEEMNKWQVFPDKLQGDVDYRFHLLPVFEGYYNSLSWYQKKIFDELCFYHYIPAVINIPRPSYFNRMQKAITGFLTAVILAVVSIVLIIFAPPAGVALFVLAIVASSFAIVSAVLQFIALFTDERTSKVLNKIGKVFRDASVLLGVATSLTEIANSFSSMSGLQIASFSIQAINLGIDLIGNAILKNQKRKAQEKLNEYQMKREELEEELKEEEKATIEDKLNYGFVVPTDINIPIELEYDYMTDLYDMEYNIRYNYDNFYDIF